MSKFHINKHGVPAPCRARQGNCPLGGEDSHFDSQESAQAEADRRNEAESGILQNMPSSDFTTKGQEYNEFKQEAVNGMLKSYFEKHGMHNEYEHVQADESEYGNIANVVDNESEEQDYHTFEQEVVGVVDYSQFNEDENGRIKERDRLSSVTDAVEYLNEAKGSKEEILAQVNEKMTDSFMKDQFSTKRDVADIGTIGEAEVARKVFEYGAKKDKLYRLYNEGPDYAKERIMNDFMRDEGANLSEEDRHYLDNTDSVDVALDKVEEYYHSPTYEFDGADERVNKISEGLENWLNGA